MLKTVIFSCLLIFGAVLQLYFMGYLWFGHSRNRQLRSFFALGNSFVCWLILYAVSLVSSESFYPYIMTMRMMVVSIIPYCFLWFFLRFINSPLTKNRLVFALICIIPTLDAVAFLTNPWHHLMFTAYTPPKPPAGPLFCLHIIFGYGALIVSLAKMLKYAFVKTTRRHLFAVACFIVLLPFILSLCFTFGFFGMEFDYSPYAFLVIIIMIGLISRRAGGFGLNTTSFSNIFAFVSEAIMVVDNNFTVVDINKTFQRKFSNSWIEAETSTLSDFSTWLHKNASSIVPDRLFEDRTLLETEFEGESSASKHQRES